MRRLALALTLLCAAPAAAQQAAAPPANPAVAAIRGSWEQVTRYLTRAAEAMPEADYAFRPTDTVRTFGQMIGHVAGAQYMICASALGDPPRAEDDIEKSRTTKAALLQALKESTEYCQRAYQMTDAQALETVTIFGQQRSRIGALLMNTTHNNEHYGNLVTYLRIRGMVPPSSQPAS